MRRSRCREGGVGALLWKEAEQSGKAAEMRTWQGGGRNEVQVLPTGDEEHETPITPGEQGPAVTATGTACVRMRHFVLYVFTRLPWIYTMCFHGSCVGWEVRMAQKNAGPERGGDLPRTPQDIRDSLM